MHGVACIDPEGNRPPSKMGILVRNNGGTGQSCIPGRGGPASRPESKLSLRFAPIDHVRDITETIQPSRATCMNDDENCVEESDGASSAGDAAGS